MRKFIKFIVRKVPRVYLIRFSFLFSKLISVFYKGDKVACTICEGRFRKFLPYGNKGDVNRLCPKCLSLERHRLLYLYLKEKTNFYSSQLKVLHIAPEQPFVKLFRKLDNLEYYTADLESPLADIKLDICDMPLDDCSWDVVICNHVLEHIDDEFKAISEVYRILTDGGWAILQVPVDYSREETFEDNTITSTKEREKIFGQYDHVRVHGRDYPVRLEKAGFEVVRDDYVRHLDPEFIEYHRLPANEIIYLCRKNKS